MENYNTPEEIYNDDQYDGVDDGIFTQQAAVAPIPKLPAHELKSLAAAVKILEAFSGEATSLLQRYSNKLKIATQLGNSQNKRPAVGKKIKQKLFIEADYFDALYKKFFLLPVMEESSLENNLKVFFEGSKLKNTVNPSDLAITEEEFNIHQDALKQDIQGYLITEKDIPLLIRRMYKKAGICSITTDDGVVTSFDAASFVGASRQDVLDCLEENRLISYDRSDATTSFCISKRLPKLLDQIPILKPLKLVDTQMEHYLTYDAFLKLVDLIRDKNELYKAIVDTDRAHQIIEKLSLPNIDGYFKPEYISTVIKDKNLKKEEFFKDANRVITGLSVIPVERNLLN